MLQVTNGALAEMTAIKNRNCRSSSPHGGTWDLEPGQGAQPGLQAQGNCRSSKKRWRHPAPLETSKTLKHTSHSTVRNKDINFKLVSLFQRPVTKDTESNSLGDAISRDQELQCIRTLSSNVQTLQITTKICCREHRQILRAAWECPWCNFLHSPPTAWDSLRTVLGRRIDSVVSGLLRVCPTILMSLFLTKHNSVTSDPIYFNAVQVSNILCY